jgi:hypothetical protein
MWGLDQNRLFKQSRYQPVAPAGEDEVGEISNSSFTNSPSINEHKEIKKDSAPFKLIHFSISSICLFASLSFFLFKYYHGISDDKCMRRFSAPSTLFFL